jgi:uncharacterized protein (TIGR02145 family)
MKNLKLISILLITFFVFACKKDKTNNVFTKNIVYIYKDVPNKEDGLVADVYNFETNYKTYFYGSFNDKGFAKNIKSIVLENKGSDTLNNYIFDENGKLYLVYQSMKNGTKIGSITKITEVDSLLSMDFYDYDWNSHTDVLVESISIDISGDNLGARKTEEDPQVDIFGFQQIEKDINTWIEERLTRLNERYANVMNSICSASNGALCGSSTQGLGGALGDLNNYIKEITQNGVNISLNDFLKSPTSDDYEPKDNEFTPPSPTSNTNTIPVPQRPQNQVPTCVITNPIYGTRILVNENINVIIEATDVDGSISSIELKLDGISQGIKIPTTNANLNYIIPAISLSKGYHYFYAIAKDNKGASKLSKAISFYVESDDNYTTVTDIDGNVYRTVKIGNQVWMAENLKTTRYNDGTEIPNITDGEPWRMTNIGAYAIHGNDPTNNTIYGKLYNWYAVGTGKLAPAGWHVPTEAEYTTLINYLGGGSVAGGAMKAIDGWLTPNVGATNSSGFSAKGGSFLNYGGDFGQLNSQGTWWTSTTTNINNVSFAKYLELYDINTDAPILYNIENSGFSVRCIKD